MTTVALDLNVLAVAADDAEHWREAWRTQKARRRARRPQGFCQKCSVRPTRHGHKDCTKCRSYEKTAKQNEYDRRVVAGLCTGCGKTQPSVGYRLCAPCIELSNTAFKVRRVRLYQRGKCICGKDSDHGFKSCADCRVRTHDRYTAELAKVGKKRHAEIRAERIAAGCCTVCATKLTNGECALCSKRRRDLQNKAERRRRLRLLAAGVCTACGHHTPESGHRMCRGCIDREIKRQQRLRRAQGLIPRAERPPRTYCRNGHLLDDRTTYVYRGRRFCRPCNTAATTRYYRRKAASRTPKPRGRPRRRSAV